MRESERPTPTLPKRLAGRLAHTESVATRAWLPLIAVLLLGADSLAVGPVPIGTALSLLLSPLWLPSLLRLRSAGALAASLITLGVSGGIVYVVSPSAWFDDAITLSVIRMTVTSALAVGVFSWAALRFGIALTAVAFGLGALIDVPLAHLPLDENSWKYYLAFPCALVLLGISARLRPWYSVAVLTLVAAASVAGGYRSMLGVCVGAVALYVLARMFRHTDLRIGAVDARPWAFLLSTAAAAAAALVAFTWLLTSGLLGERAREATELALARGGDLITGGRVEWIATAALFHERPWGYGPGYVPTERETQIILDAYGSAGVEPSLQHIRDYVLGGQLKLHAIYADFWVNFGPLATLLFLAICAVILYRFVSNATTRMSQPILMWFLLTMTVWDLAFSPIYSNLSHVTLSLVLLAAAASSRKEERT